MGALGIFGIAVIGLVNLTARTVASVAILGVAMAAGEAVYKGARAIKEIRIVHVKESEKGE